MRARTTSDEAGDEAIPLLHRRTTCSYTMLLDV